MLYNLHRALLAIMCLFPAALALSQTLPKEGRVLNYRIVGFSFPQARLDECRLEIAAGDHNREDSFTKHIFFRETVHAEKKIVEVPSFGASYTWRLVCSRGRQEHRNFHHFCTGMSDAVDTQSQRLQILKRAETSKDAFIFLDGGKALYDMSGDPVWYLPNIGKLLTANTQVRDMKMTGYGTITFLLSDGHLTQACEVNYNGDLLWKAPNDGKVNGEQNEYYHHVLTRLSNGHYMVMGTEHVPVKVPAIGHSGKDDSVTYQMPFGTVIEYDEKGRVVWQWKSSAYFLYSDIFNYTDARTGMPIPDVHDNSFSFDERKKCIYVSYKNISRVLKISYPDGVVSAVYGEVFKAGVPASYNELFCYQHACKVSRDGGLYVFNNNDCRWPQRPVVVKMREDTASGKLKKIWEFTCPTEDIEQQIVPGITLGGNITELTDSSILVSECSPFATMFIVSTQKEILWKALPQKKLRDGGGWETLPQYRTSLIQGRKGLERLIWRTGHDNTSEFDYSW